MDAEDVRLERHGPVAHIVLNRPDKLNALTLAMYRRIGQLLAELDADRDVRVVVLRGEGRAFSAGFDLAEEFDDRRDFQARGAEWRRQQIVEVANVNRWRIWGLSKPVIAKLHGYCLAGALELVLPCDFILASRDCQLGEPEVLYGAGPAFLIVPWLVSVPRAKDILLTGRRFTGEEAAAWGLITRAVPAAELDAETDRLGAHLAKLPPPALQLGKAGINRAYEVRGMRTAIDGWVDTALLLHEMETDEVREFKRRVGEGGIKAALAWRDAWYAKLLAGAGSGG
jgi:enoyl-CoA hydratase/carnithine racemase